MEPTLYRQFVGGWCDNCEMAAMTKACPDCGQPMRPARITVEPTDQLAAEPATQPAKCAEGSVRSGVECDSGLLDWRVRYYVGSGKKRREAEVSDPMCRTHAQYEERWTQSVGAITYGIAERIQEG